MEHTEQPTRAFPEVPWFSEAWTRLPPSPLGFRWFGDMWAAHANDQQKGA